MSLTEQLTDYVHAAFSGLWVLTQEPDEAEREIAALARGRGWKLACWDVAGGLRCPDAPRAAAEAGAGDPLAVLRAVPALADRDGTALVLLHNFHRFMSSPEVVPSRSASAGTARSTASGSPAPASAAWGASGQRRPRATSQQASFQPRSRARAAISRSASSGSWVKTHRPLKAACM